MGRHLMLMHRTAESQATLHNVQLTDRVLYSDGDSVVSVDQIMALLSSGVNTTGLCVDNITSDIEQFNKYVPKDEQIQLKTETRPNDMSWVLPQDYAEVDPMAYVVQTFYDLADTEGFATLPNSFSRRKNRVVQELIMYKDLDLLPVLRVLIYIINTLREKNIVWGVGRGSSVSSYVLYVIGVHDVDSVEYDLDIHDFLRP